ncbi:MAG: PaaI family thioesterase [Acidimicrobiales bacterium]
MDLEQLAASMPFARVLGLELTNAAPERVEGTMSWTTELCTTGDLMHGGALMALADSVGAICAFLNLPEGATTSTIEPKTNFFRAVRGGTVTATSSPLHVGRTTIVVQTSVIDVRSKPVSLSIQTQAVIQ